MSSSGSVHPSQAYLREYVGYKLVNTGIIFITLETIFVALRILSRRIQKTPFGWDDYLVPFALVFCIGNSILGFLAVQHGGVGHHIEAVAQTPEKIAYWYKTCLIATPVIYVIAAALPKAAILAVYLRIFVDKFSRISCYILVGIVVVNTIANIPALIWKCDPISYGWNPTTPGGSCGDTESRLRYGSLANIVTDVAMLLLPIPLIWKLQTDRATKIGLGFTFLAGGIGLVTSILRFAAFFATMAFTDGTWASVNLLIWCIVEPGIYLIAACLIVCRPLLGKFIQETRLRRLSEVLSRSQKSSSKDTSGGKRSSNAGYLELQPTKQASLGLSGSRTETMAERGGGPRPDQPDRIHVAREVFLDTSTDAWNEQDFQ